MYIIPVFALACLLGRLVWRGLGKTALPRAARIALTALAVVLGALLAYCGLLYLSVFLFLWNDRPTW